MKKLFAIATVSLLVISVQASATSVIYPYVKITGDWDLQSRHCYIARPRTGLFSFVPRVDSVRKLSSKGERLSFKKDGQLILRERISGFHHNQDRKHFRFAKLVYNQESPETVSLYQDGSEQDLSRVHLSGKNIIRFMSFRELRLISKSAACPKGQVVSTYLRAGLPNDGLH